MNEADIESFEVVYHTCGIPVHVQWLVAITVSSFCRYKLVVSCAVEQLMLFHSEDNERRRKSYAKQSLVEPKKDNSFISSTITCRSNGLDDS